MNDLIKIRKILTSVEETRHEGEPRTRSKVKMG